SSFMAMRGMPGTASFAPQRLTRREARAEPHAQRLDLLLAHRMRHPIRAPFDLATLCDRNVAGNLPFTNCGRVAKVVPGR
ncbi:hypothetical protein, partial [Paraburkholderia podalyriae]|uniref:hypothetical protein n=1 Tax=Paraburkholderia podalyriae TaxID=1938811 RepID=UPI001CA39F50